MKKRSYISIAAVIAATTLGAGLTAMPAQAAAAPAYQLATDDGTNTLCMNRAGGGTSNNTPVIAYNCGDNNNDFHTAPLTTACGGGDTVTETCPFTVGSGLNAAFYGDPIVAVFAYNENKCVGGSNSTDLSAKLEPCPADNGLGGGWSTVDVLAYSHGNNPPYHFIVNRNWSDTAYSVGQSTGADCYGLECAEVIGTAGYKSPLCLNTGDSGIQNGDFQNAAPGDTWGEV
jgi:hypothetical protein